MHFLLARTLTLQATRRTSRKGASHACAPAHHRRFRVVGVVVFLLFGARFSTPQRRTATGDAAKILSTNFMSVSLEFL